MSANLRIHFDAAGPVVDGSATAQGTATPAPLTPPVTDPAFTDPLAFAWTPDVPLTLTGADLATAFGEYAMDVTLTAVTATRPGTLVCGAGVPVVLTLAPDAGGGMLLTAVVRTTGAAATLSATAALPAPGAALRVGVWVAGTEAVLAVAGTAVARRRMTAPVAAVTGTVTIGAAEATTPPETTPTTPPEPARTTAECAIVAVILADHLDTAQEAELARAAADGLGEIDSLVANGTEGAPGAATGAEARTGRLRWRTYADGTAYWTAATGAHLVRGRIGEAYTALGGATGRLGLPTSAESGVDALLDRFRAKPRGRSGLSAWDVLSPAGRLADLIHLPDAIHLPDTTPVVTAPRVSPVSPVTRVTPIRRTADAVTRRRVDLTPVVTHATTSVAVTEVRSVSGLLAASLAAPRSFLSNDTIAAAITSLRPDLAEASRPLDEAPRALTDLVADSSRVGATINMKVGDLGYIVLGPRAQLFQHGIVILTAGAGPIALFDEIFAHWLLLGGTRGFLGAPRGPQIDVVGGSYADFGGGRIYWSARTGAHEVHGAILARYFNSDGTDRAFGFPTSDELPVDGYAQARMSTFERGTIFWTPATGALTLGGDFLAAWMAGGGLAHYGLPTTEVQEANRNGVNYRWQSFERGVILWTDALGCVDTMTVRIARVATGNIDDGVEFSGFIPRSDTTAELIVKAWVYVDGVEVLHRESGHGGAAMDFSDWETAPFALQPETTVRVRIEAWDWDEISSDDRLADHDVTYTFGGDLWGYLPASGSHLAQPSTWNDSDNAGAGAVTFDYAISPPVAIDLDRMREAFFWRFRNKGRDTLPWRMYKETFIDIDGDDVNYLTDPLDSWYYDSQYEDVADGGNCFGFSTSALDAFDRRGGVPQPLSQQSSDRVDDEVWRVINRGQGSQKAASVTLYKIGAKLEPDFCDPRRVWARVKAITDAGSPVLISMRGYDDAADEGEGHAVLAHHCDQLPDGTRRILIADSNVPYGPGFESDDTSLIAIAADGSYVVQPASSYAKYTATAFVSGTLGKRYLFEIPDSAYATPLRTPVWDTATALACLVGGIMTSDGAAIAQVEAGGRTLVGDQRRRVLDDLRAQSTIVAAAVDAGLVQRAVEQPAPAVGEGADAGAAASVTVTALRDQARLVSAAALFADVEPDRVDAANARTGFAAALAQLPAAGAARASWGAVPLVSHDYADRIEADLSRHGSLIDVITAGALPEVAFVHGDEDRGGREIVAFRGAVPDEVILTLRGRGGVYRSALLGGGGLVRVSATLGRRLVDTITGQQLATARPGVRIVGSGDARLADVSLDVRAAAAGGAVGGAAGGAGGGAAGWAVTLGVGGGAAASVRWLAGRPGLRLQHATAVPAGQLVLRSGRVAYPVAAAQAGEVVRIAPDNAASPLGAARIERLSVLGELLSSDVVDAVAQ